MNQVNNFGLCRIHEQDYRRYSSLVLVYERNTEPKFEYSQSLCRSEGSARPLGHPSVSNEGWTHHEIPMVKKEPFLRQFQTLTSSVDVLYSLGLVLRLTDVVTSWPSAQWRLYLQP